MLPILTLKCANCGANLEVRAETETFACGYCGASQMVERHGGTVSLRLLTDSISKVQVGTDKTAAELAIRRLKEEYEDLKKSYRSLATKKSDVQKEIGTGFGGICIFATVMCLTAIIFGSWIAVFSIIMYVVILIICFVFYTKAIGKTTVKYDKLLQKLTIQGEEIQQRITKNKKIVDS